MTVWINLKWRVPLTSFRECFSQRETTPAHSFARDPSINRGGRGGVDSWRYHSNRQGVNLKTQDQTSHGNLHSREVLKFSTS